MANEQIYINKLKTEIAGIKDSLKNTDEYWHEESFSTEKDTVFSVIAEEVFEIENYYNSDTKIQLFEKLDAMTQRYPAQSNVRNAFLTAFYRNFNRFYEEDLINSSAFQKVTQEVAQKYKTGDFEHLHIRVPYKLLPYVYPTKKYENKEDFVNDLHKIKDNLLNDMQSMTYIAQNPYDEIDERQLNSRAILGEISDSFNYNPQSSLYDKNIYKVLAGGIGLAFFLSPQEQRLWSEIAGKIKDENLVKALTDALDGYYNYHDFDKSRMLLTMIFNNETAQKQQQKFLQDNYLEHNEIAQALARTPTITPVVKDVLERNFGPNFTEAYLENKNKIDRTPRKDLLYNILSDFTAEADFFMDLAQRLKKVAKEPQFAGNDDRNCLKESLNKNESEFRKRAMLEFQNMLQEQNNSGNFKIPERETYRNDNVFFRKNFPELVEAYRQQAHLSTQKIDNAIDYCYRVSRLQKALSQSKKEQNLDGRLIEDIARLGNISYEQGQKIIDLFYKCNLRPDTYGSDHNMFYPAQIAPVVKRDFPEWMNLPILQAVNNGVIKADRLGSEKNLFDACKTWKINPYVWKKEAEAIGRMPLKSRMIACGIYSKLMDEERRDTVNGAYRSKPLSKSKKDQFWHIFKQAQDMEMDRAFDKYVRNSIPNKHRTVDLLQNPRISKEDIQVFTQFLSLGNILNLKVNHYHKAVNVIMDLQWKQDGHEGKVSGYYFKNVKKLEGEDASNQKFIIADSNGNQVDFYDFYTRHKNNILPSALALSRVFGSAFPNYLKKALPYTSIHDATYWLPKNLTSKQNQEFAKFVIREIEYYDTNGVKHMRDPSEMQVIARNWDMLKEEEKRLSYKELLAVCKSKYYKDMEYVNFAREAASHGISEHNYKYYEKIYAAGLHTPTPIATDARFKCQELTGRFLPRDDVRVGFFGQYTGCCQHFGPEAIGEKCAISSVKDPFSQLFVVENREGEIVAGSWVWVNKVSYEDKNGQKQMYKTCTFDNIEGKLSYSDQGDTILNIYKQVGKYLAEQDYRQITIGTANSDVSLEGFDSVASIPLNPMYSGYSDSSAQVLLAENPNAAPTSEKASELYVTGACQDDEKEMQHIANQCFPDSDQSLSMPTYSPKAMLLKDKGRTVGYIIWSEDQNNIEYDGNRTSNWIYDMAVLPDYRGQKGGDTRGEGSLLLLNAMMKHVKEVGGEWGAELRDKTTLKYMTMMSDTVKNGEIAGIAPNFEGRCLIDLEILSHDHSMGDGSNVYAVKFNVLDKKERAKRLKMRLDRGNSSLSAQIVSKSQEGRA